MSRPSAEGACAFDREVLFTVRRDGSDPHWIDAKAYREVIDFLRTDLGLRLDVSEYFLAYEGKFSRDHYTGRVRRRLPLAAPASYAFDLEAPTDYRGTSADYQAIRDAITQSFKLPLAYAPSTYETIDEAKFLVAPPFDVLLPAACPEDSCEPGVETCVVIPEGTELCGHFRERRDLVGERAYRVRLGLKPGKHRLEDRGTVDLVSDVEFGSSATPLIPEGPAMVRMLDGRLTLTQTVSAGGTRMGLSANFGPGVATVYREPASRGLYFVAKVEGAPEVDATIGLENCSATGYPRFFAEAHWGADSVRLTYRQGSPNLRPGVLIPTRADVVLDGQAITVDRRFDLVYAGQHHNWDNNFWIFFSSPVAYRGHEVWGLWIDEAVETCCPADHLATIDADGQVIDELPPQSYLRSPMGWY